MNPINIVDKGSPLARLLKFGFTLPFASVKAVPMSPIATVRVAGVGAE
jgi:hypothetical protein